MVAYFLMGSLENALTLARAVGHTFQTVQGPRDVRPTMDALVRSKFSALHQQGPVDQWWQGVAVLYDDCMGQTPKDCVTLAEYNQWAEHMVRFWHTVLSARAIIVAWAGRDPTSLETKISPSSDLIGVRDIDVTKDLPKGKFTTKLETIGNETIEAMKKRGIDCFDPWTTARYRTRLSLAAYRKQGKVMHHQTDSSLLCGFYAWMQRKPHPPPSALPRTHRIGQESLRTRTLWTEEIVPERVGFCSVGVRNLTTINEYEPALRIALDLMKASIAAKLPLVLPEQRTAQP